MVVAHGNGPQVGMINIAMTTLSREDHSHPIAPMSVCTAMSQGYIGYDLQNSLREELLNRGIQKPVATVLTQVEVDPADPAFQNPSKPIGTFMTEEEAEEMRRRGNCVMEDAGRGWRRCVASPKPKAIVEIETIRTLMEAGQVVIGCGGGGIPVYRTEGNHLKGAGAVIDKDFASELLAEQPGRGRPHHPHRRGEGGHQLRQAGPEVAGSPDAGGGPAVRGGGPVRPRLHAAQGPGCREVRRSPSPAAQPSSPCWRRPRTASPEKPAPPSPCKIQKRSICQFSTRRARKSLSLFVFFVLLLCTLPKVDLFRSVFFWSIRLKKVKIRLNFSV